MTHSKPPILVLGRSGRVYVVTDYTFHANGAAIALAKHDVTGQFQVIAERKAASEAVSGGLSPPPVQASGASGPCP